MEVGVASSAPLAAKAGARLADQGGNAVDAAVAAVLSSAVTDPGLCGLAGSGALTIWPPDGDPITIEGTPAMPGFGAPADRVGQGMTDAIMGYGGGWPTRVGPGSVAVHGLVAACGEALRRYGTRPWQEVVEPAYLLARDGFAWAQGSRQFMADTHDAIFGWNTGGIADLLDEAGQLHEAGAHITLSDLDQSLRALAEGGPEEIYSGALGQRLADHVTEHGGLLTREDLRRYRPGSHPCARGLFNGWQIATYPLPSIGGSILLAMLRLFGRGPGETWSAEFVAHLVKVQSAVLTYRRDRLDGAEDLEAELQEMRRLAERGDLSAWSSPSTVHSSAVDSNGLACAVTASNGFGSGVVPPGTGIAMANPLGEVELNVRDLSERRPGERLLTNMAPTIARRDDGAVLAIGSPGADRITTAILQTLVGYFGGMSLEDAVAHPRAHVELSDEGTRLACEGGVDTSGVALPLRQFEGLDLFFGGVAVVCWQPGEGLSLAGDPRRGCGLATGGR